MKLVPVSSQLSKKITCYVRRSYLLRWSWRCALQRWNLGRNASGVMEDCKADGRSAHRQDKRMRHAKRRASSYESKPRTVRQAPSPRGRTHRALEGVIASDHLTAPQHANRQRSEMHQELG